MKLFNLFNTKAKKSKKLKKIYIYALLEADPSTMPEQGGRISPSSIDFSKIIAFAPTKDELILAADKYCFFKVASHYGSWCTFHDQIPGYALPSWTLYKKETAESGMVTSIMHNLQVVRLPYSQKDIIKIIKTITFIPPLGIEEDADKELVDFLTYRSALTGGKIVAPKLYEEAMSVDIKTNKWVMDAWSEVKNAKEGAKTSETGERE